MIVYVDYIPWIYSRFCCAVYCCVCITMKSPRVGVTLCFQFVSAAAASAAATTSKPFQLNLRYLEQRIYRSGKLYWMTFLWPWPNVMAVALINKDFACLHDKVRITDPITTKSDSLVALLMVITWLDLGGILLETVNLANFLYKFRMCFFKVKHYFGHISGMVGPIDVKRKAGASVGYRV